MPNWLPALIPVDPWPHNKYEELYGIFCRELRDVSFRYMGHYVWFFSDMEDGKEKIFWHLTSRKQNPIPRRKMRFYPPGQKYDPEDRWPDLPRCARLSWVRPITENANDQEVKAWDYLEDDGSVHTYAWLCGEDFVVIFKKMGNGSRRLVTSFYVDQEYTRNDLQRKYDSRII